MTRRQRGILLTCVLLLAALAVESPAQGKIEVYRVQYRTAQELQAVAQTALAGTGSATVDAGSNSLVLVGPSAQVTQAMALLRELDQRRQSVLIHFESRRRDEIAESGLEIDWQVAAGNLRIGTVIVPGEASGARVIGSSQARERSGGFQGTVRVLDGEVGYIGSGASVPVRSRWEIQRVEAERGFYAQPRVQGDGKVQIQISPNEGQVDRAGRTRFVRGGTTVTVTPGETAVIGGLQRRSDTRVEGSRVLSSDRASDERLWLLRVELPQ